MSRDLCRGWKVPSVATAAFRCNCCLQLQLLPHREGAFSPLSFSVAAFCPLSLLPRPEREKREGERESERERERERETSGAMRRQRPCTLQECGVSLGAACVALNSCFFCCCRTTSRTLTAKLAHNCLPNAPTHRRFPLEYMVRNNNYVRTIFIYLYPGGRRIMCSRYVGNAALDVFQRR